MDTDTDMHIDTDTRYRYKYNTDMDLDIDIQYRYRYGHRSSYRCVRTFRAQDLGFCGEERGCRGVHLGSDRFWGFKVGVSQRSE